MKRITLDGYTYSPNVITLFNWDSPLGKTYVDGGDISVETYDDELINLALSLEEGEEVIINDTYIATCMGVMSNGADMPYDIYFKSTRELENANR